MLVVTTASSSSGRGHPIPHPAVSRHYPAPPGGDAPRGAHGLHPPTPPSQMMHRLPHPGAGGGGGHPGHYPPGGGGGGGHNGPPSGYHPMPSPPPGSMVTLDRSSQQHLRGGQPHPPHPPHPPGPPHSHLASASAPGGLGLMKR